MNRSYSSQAALSSSSERLPERAATPWIPRAAAPSPTGVRRAALRLLRSRQRLAPYTSLGSPSFHPALSRVSKRTQVATYTYSLDGTLPCLSLQLESPASRSWPARALGRRVEAPGRPGWPMVRRTARRTARHAARGGPERSLAASTRTSGRRGRSAASSRSCRWRSAGASAALGRSRRSRAAARAGRGGASPAHESGKTRIEPTRWPRVPGRRGWARDPRRARRSGLERPVGRDPHFGHSLTGA